MITIRTTTDHVIVADRQTMTTYKPPSEHNPDFYFVVWSKVGRNKKKFQGFWTKKGDDRPADLRTNYNIKHLTQ